MIEQDSYWREDLVRFGERLEKHYRRNKWSGRIKFNIEKDIFLSFYIIRKLIERDKLTGGTINPKIINAQHKITMYPAAVGIQPLNDPSTFGSNYLLMNGSPETLNLEQICNQFIHSLIFSPFAPMKRNMVGIFFASDRQSLAGMYYITLVKVIELIISVATNRPIKLKLRRVANLFKVTQGRGRLIT